MVSRETWRCDVFLISGFVLCILSMEVCDERNNITMCPMCDRACSYWKLVTACGTARASHLFDNAATVFFAIFMALWGQQLCSPFMFTRTLRCCCTPTVVSLHIEGRLALTNVEEICALVLHFSLIPPIFIPAQMLSFLKSWLFWLKP